MTVRQIKGCAQTFGRPIDNEGYQSAHFGAASILCCIPSLILTLLSKVSPCTARAAQQYTQVSPSSFPRNALVLQNCKNPSSQLCDFSNPCVLPRAFGRRIDTKSPTSASPLFQAWHEAALAKGKFPGACRGKLILFCSLKADCILFSANRDRTMLAINKNVAALFTA